MLKGLRGRLIFSYALVILVALAIALVAMLFLVRPAQINILQARLSNELTLLRRPLIQAAERAPNQTVFLNFLRQRAADFPSRTVFLNEQQVIGFDSQGEWQGQNLRLRQRNEAQPASELSSGLTLGPDRRRYVYAVSPLLPAEVQGQPPSALNRWHVVLIAPFPRLTDPIIRDLGQGFAVAGLLAFGLAWLLSVVIARSIAAPLQDIARSAGAVAQGDYSQKATVAGPAEVQQVARSFNEMTTQVQRSQTAMRDFVSNVSHELKTPLTSIQGFSQALVEGATQDETSRQRAASIIHDEAQRLRRLVDDFLNLARFDAGQLSLQHNPVELHRLLGAIVDRLAPQSQAKNLQVQRALNPLPPLLGDGDRLTQAFTNLLDNAIKHTPPGGEIRLSLQLAVSLPTLPPQPGVLPSQPKPQADSPPHYAQITFSDTGPGIPPEALERIFERFYQVDESRSQGPGVGLGLSIAQEIIVAHQGYLQAQSQPGAGSQFTVWLPFREA